MLIFRYSQIIVNGKNGYTMPCFVNYNLSFLIKKIPLRGKKIENPHLKNH